MFYSSKTKHIPEGTDQFRTYDSQGNECWEVETIIDRKYSRSAKSFRYLVKWKGFPIEASTWEPMENLSGAQKMLKEFEKNYDEVVLPLEPSYIITGPPPKPLDQGNYTNTEDSSATKDSSQSKSKLPKHNKPNKPVKKYKKAEFLKGNAKMLDKTRETRGKYQRRKRKTLQRTGKTAYKRPKSKKRKDREIRDISPLHLNQLRLEDIESPEIRIESFILEGEEMSGGEFNDSVPIDADGEQDEQLDFEEMKGPQISLDLSLLNGRNSGANKEVSENAMEANCFNETLEEKSFASVGETKKSEATELSVIVDEATKPKKATSKKKYTKYRPPVGSYKTRKSKRFERLKKTLDIAFQENEESSTTPVVNHLNFLHNTALIPSILADRPTLDLLGSGNAFQEQITFPQDNSAGGYNLFSAKEPTKMLVGGLVSDFSSKSSLTMPDQICLVRNGIMPHFEQPKPRTPRAKRALGIESGFFYEKTKGLFNPNQSSGNQTNNNVATSKIFDMAELVGFCSPVIILKPFSSDDEEEDVPKRKNIESGTSTTSPQISQATTTAPDQNNQNTTATAQMEVIEDSSCSAQNNEQANGLVILESSYNQLASNGGNAGEIMKRLEKIGWSDVLKWASRNKIVSDAVNEVNKLKENLEAQVSKQKPKEINMKYQRITGSRAKFEEIKKENKEQTQKRRYIRKELKFKRDTSLSKEEAREKERDKKSDNEQKRITLKEIISFILEKNLARDKMFNQSQYQNEENKEVITATDELSNQGNQQEISDLTQMVIPKQDEEPQTKSIIQTEGEQSLTQHEETQLEKMQAEQQTEDTTPIEVCQTDKRNEEEEKSRVNDAQPEHDHHHIEGFNSENKREDSSTGATEDCEGRVPNEFLDAFSPQGNLKEDEIKEVEHLKDAGTGSQMFKITWKPRSDGTQKQPSIVCWEDIKSKVPEEFVKHFFPENVPTL